MAEECWTWGSLLSKRHLISTVILACYHCWKLQSQTQLAFLPHLSPVVMLWSTICLLTHTHGWLPVWWWGRQADATNQWDVSGGGSSEPAPLPGNPRQGQKQKVDFQFLFPLKKYIKKAISFIKIEKQPLNLSHLEKKNTVSEYCSQFFRLCIFRTLSVELISVIWYHHLSCFSQVPSQMLLCLEDGRRQKWYATSCFLNREMIKKYLQLLITA